MNFSQELLRTPGDLWRWSLCCSSVADWQALADRMAASDSRVDQDLADVLANEFVPVIRKLIIQKVGASFPFSLLGRE